MEQVELGNMGKYRLSCLPVHCEESLFLRTVFLKLLGMLRIVRADSPGSTSPKVGFHEQDRISCAGAAMV